MRKKWFCKEKMGKVGVKRMLKSVRGIINSNNGTFLKEKVTSKSDETFPAKTRTISDNLHRFKEKGTSESDGTLPTKTVHFQQNKT